MHKAVTLTTFRRIVQHFNIYLLIRGFTLVLSGKFLPARSGQYLGFCILKDIAENIRKKLPDFIK